VSTLKVNNLQVGQDGTAANNYTLYQPIVPDGTVRLGYGVAGSVTDILTLKNSRLGIGTNDPQGQLTVVLNNNGLEFNPGSGQSIVSYNRSTSAYQPVGMQGSTVGLYIGGVGESLHITSNGSTVIGGTTPATTSVTQLTLRSNGQVGLSLLCGAIQNSTIYMGGLADGYSSGDSGYSDGAISYNNSSNHMQFDTAGTEKLRITSAGYVGIGTDSPDGKLDVRGTIFVNGDATGGRIFASGGSLSLTDGNGRQTLRIDDPGSGNTHTHVFDSNGRLGINSTTPAVKLDIRSTDAIRVPVGTTGERPTGAAGYIRYNSSIASYEGHNGSEWAGIGGAAEVETAVSSTSATTCESFAKASYRSASIVAQITQGSSYQVGNYLLIHDGTTATLVEESAVATGDMLGTFTATISGSNVVFQVNMNSASSATVTTMMTKVSIP